MRRALLALAGCVALTGVARAGDPFPFSDAALHAVQFVDREEGWAVGDEGVVWHTIDHGTTWERQPTGVRASLRGLHFLNPYTGWVVGREELPGGQSAGVLLYTRDGGLKWRRIGENALPGLAGVRFLDGHTGIVFGDGTDQFPSGVFATADFGRTWTPVPGPRCPGWLAGQFADAQSGALVGPWGRVAAVRDGRVGPADADGLAGRAVTGLATGAGGAVAVGEGGLVLLSPDAVGGHWTFANLPLSPEQRAGWDFRAVATSGDNVWVAGRPGAKLLHSRDRGKTWEVQTTGQPLPLNALFFADDSRGWAVGELGSILNTTDGGKTWRVQRRGGQRCAVLLISSRPSRLPADAIAVAGARDGYLAAAFCVNAADPAGAPSDEAHEGVRFAAAVRKAGGAAGEVLWQFPLADYMAEAGKPDLLKAWDGPHAGRAAEDYLRQVVLALRVWRPDVVVTDHPDADRNPNPADALVAEAAREAFGRAADPACFPEQIRDLGLESWKASKLYARWHGPAGAQVAIDLDEPDARLGATVRDFADGALAVAAPGQARPPLAGCYRLLESRIDGAEAHRDLTAGLVLAPAGVARRELPPIAPTDDRALKSARAARNLRALAEGRAAGLTDPAKLVGHIGSELDGLPDDQGAAAALAVAGAYSHRGQWQFAREIYLLMADRYPAHPLTANAYRWLVHHNASSEARRRQELGQFKVAREDIRFRGTETEVELTGKDAKATAKVKGNAEAVTSGQVALLADRQASRRWYQGCIDPAKRLAAYGPLFERDPALQLCVQSARRNLGEVQAARDWCTHFSKSHPADGPCAAAAAAELWLANRNGNPPKPVAACPCLGERPYLDGVLDDGCWQDLKPIVLAEAEGQTAKDCPTDVWLAYDDEYLYLAARCRRQGGTVEAPTETRSHDADLRGHDRLELYLDLDRDYATYFRLSVDERGCVADDCWGDPSWDPQWFVARHADETGWQVEAAIPLAELTSERVSGGKVWAANVVRVLPGRGVQAFSTPAGVEPRPEGLGLLVFGQEAVPTKSKNVADKPADAHPSPGSR